MNLVVFFGAKVSSLQLQQVLLLLVVVVGLSSRCSLGQSTSTKSSTINNSRVRSSFVARSSLAGRSFSNKRVVVNISDIHPTHGRDTSSLSSFVSGVKSSSSSSSACDCMDYWQCAAKNGQVYSYCGISDSEVCCFSNSPDNNNAQAVNKVANYNEVIFSSNEQTDEVAQDDGISKPRRKQIIAAGLYEDVDHTTTVSLLDPGFEVISPTCGIAEVPVQINSNARFQEWPWHVAILESLADLYICGGTLISPKVVLTAAHCISGYAQKSNSNSSNNKKLKVRAGEFDVSGNHEVYPHVEVAVSRIIIHPEFNNASLANDIAVVHLAQNLTYGPNIQALCLPPLIPPPRRKIPFDNQICVVTGWGRRSAEDETYSVKLKEVRVKLWSKDRCEERLRKNFGSNFFLPSTALCASDEKGEDGGVCDGDGGGPLACWNKEDGKWYGRGVVSFGIGCGQPDSPGVYSRISSYTKWISQVA